MVALPSTVHGHFWSQAQIDRLLRERQLISIAEHIAPIRPDGLIQTPNIVDDMDELRRLYKYLRGKRVWHANGTDIASYVVARSRSLIYDVTKDGFSIQYDGAIPQPLLTLRVEAAAICSPAQPLIDIGVPGGTIVERSQFRYDRRRFSHLVTIPVTSGRYTVTPRA
jgi:hypothetical protein